MGTDRRFRRLRKLLQTESTPAKAADRVEVDEDAPLRSARLAPILTRRSSLNSEGVQA